MGVLTNVNVIKFTPSLAQWTAALQAIGAVPGAQTTISWTVKAVYTNTNERGAYTPAFNPPYRRNGLYHPLCRD